MRISKTVLNGSTAILATLALAACGGGTETATTDENTAVTDVDPGEGDGTINDTTLIDGTIGAEEAMGMESRMPADSRETAQSDEEPASAPPAQPAAEEPTDDEEDADASE
jgi:hypothetical protein